MRKLLMCSGLWGLSKKWVFCGKNVPLSTIFSFLFKQKVKETGIAYVCKYKNKKDKIKAMYHLKYSPYILATRLQKINITFAV